MAAFLGFATGKGSRECWHSSRRANKQKDGRRGLFADTQGLECVLHNGRAFISFTLMHMEKNKSFWNTQGIPVPSGSLASVPVCHTFSYILCQRRGVFAGDASGCHFNSMCLQSEESPSQCWKLGLLPTWFHLDFLFHFNAHMDWYPLSLSNVTIDFSPLPGHTRNVSGPVFHLYTFASLTSSGL